jgi:P-type Cu+ transporter
VVFADLGVSAGLPAHTKTTVRLRPDCAGTFGFACGMNMVHGTLVVAPADDTSIGTSVEPVTADLDAGDGGGSAAEAEAADMAERCRSGLWLRLRIAVPGRAVDADPP